MTQQTDDDHPTIPLLDLLELENNRRFGEIVKNSEKVAQALQKIALAVEKLPDAFKALQRIDDTLARLADASEAFTSLFGSVLGAARTESGEPTGFLQIAGPLGVRGGAR